MIFPPEGEKHNRCLGAVHVVIPEQYISAYIVAFSARINASYGTERPFCHDFYYRDSKGNVLGDKNLSDETLMYALLKRKTMSPHLREALDIAVDLANDTKQFSGEYDKPSPPITDIADLLRQIQAATSVSVQKPADTPTDRDFTAKAIPASWRRKRNKINLDAVIRFVFDECPEAKTFSSKRLLLYLQDFARKKNIKITITASRIRQLEVWKENDVHRMSGKAKNWEDMNNAPDEDAIDVNSIDYEND